MDLGITDKVALVTGGSRGLGRQAAFSLAREGAKVAICARTREALDQTVQELRGLGATAEGVAGDVGDSHDCERIHRETVAALGPVDILVNNVGGRSRGNVLEATEEQWKQSVDLTLMAAVRMTKLVLPGMQARRWGRIVNIASIWGREYGGSAAYMATKAALIALTKHTALAVIEDGVLVNSVAPGSILVPGGSWDRFQRNEPPEVVRRFIEGLPMGRFGWPEPVGDLVAFLASERAGFLTGACINIDGGQSHSLV